VIAKLQDDVVMVSRCWVSEMRVEEEVSKEDRIEKWLRAARVDSSQDTAQRMEQQMSEKEPMILIPSNRLGSYRLSTSGQNVGEKMNKGHE